MKIILIYIGFVLLFSCKETVVVNNCIKTKTIKWHYVIPNHKVGFKIYFGETSPDKLLTTIPLSFNPQTSYSTTFDMCISNYISITAFDDYGNESAFSKILCLGTGCRPIEYNKTLGTSKEPPPGIVLE